MINFKQTASKSLSSCSLMIGREKISTSEILEKNPDFITVEGFDFMNSTQGEYAVVTLSEYPSRYYPGGMSLTNICRSWVDAYEGDIDQANQDLKESGGCRIKLEKIRTQKGNFFVKISIL